MGSSTEMPSFKQETQEILLEKLGLYTLANKIAEIEDPKIILYLNNVINSEVSKNNPNINTLDQFLSNENNELNNHKLADNIKNKLQGEWLIFNNAIIRDNDFFKNVEAISSYSATAETYNAGSFEILKNFINQLNLFVNTLPMPLNGNSANLVSLVDFFVNNWNDYFLYEKLIETVRNTQKDIEKDVNKMLQLNPILRNDTSVSRLLSEVEAEKKNQLSFSAFYKTLLKTFELHEYIKDKINEGHTSFDIALDKILKNQICGIMNADLNRRLIYLNNLFIVSEKKEHSFDKTVIEQILYELGNEESLMKFQFFISSINNTDLDGNISFPDNVLNEWTFQQESYYRQLHNKLVDIEIKYNIQQTYNDVWNKKESVNDRPLITGTYQPSNYADFSGVSGAVGAETNPSLQIAEDGLDTVVDNSGGGASGPPIGGGFGGDGFDGKGNGSRPTPESGSTASRVTWVPWGQRTDKVLVPETLLKSTEKTSPNEQVPPGALDQTNPFFIPHGVPESTAKTSPNEQVLSESQINMKALYNEFQTYHQRDLRCRKELSEINFDRTKIYVPLIKVRCDEISTLLVFEKNLIDSFREDEIKNYSEHLEKYKLMVEYEEKYLMYLPIFDQQSRVEGINDEEAKKTIKENIETIINAYSELIKNSNYTNTDELGKAYVEYFKGLMQQLIALNEKIFDTDGVMQFSEIPLYDDEFGLPRRLIKEELKALNGKVGFPPVLTVGESTLSGSDIKANAEPAITPTLESVSELSVLPPVTPETTPSTKRFRFKPWPNGSMLLKPEITLPKVKAEPVSIEAGSVGEGANRRLGSLEEFVRVSTLAKDPPTILRNRYRSKLKMEPIGVTGIVPVEETGIQPLFSEHGQAHPVITLLEENPSRKETAEQIKYFDTLNDEINKFLEEGENLSSPFHEVHQNDRFSKYGELPTYLSKLSDKIQVLKNLLELLPKRLNSILLLSKNNIGKYGQYWFEYKSKLVRSVELLDSFSKEYHELSQLSLAYGLEGNQAMFNTTDVQISNVIKELRAKIIMKKVENPELAAHGTKQCIDLELFNGEAVIKHNFWSADELPILPGSNDPKLFTQYGLSALEKNLEHACKIKIFEGFSKESLNSALSKDQEISIPELSNITSAITKYLESLPIKQEVSETPVIGESAKLQLRYDWVRMVFEKILQNLKNDQNIHYNSQKAKDFLSKKENSD